MRRAIVRTVVTALAVTAGMESAFRAGVLSRVENAFLDAVIRSAGTRAHETHVVLVAVDDAALEAHADEPLVFWGGLFAKAIGNLRAAGARTIALDFLFPVSGEDWLANHGDDAGARSFDAPFRAELSHGDVILGAFLRIRPGAPAIELPNNSLLFSLPDRRAGVALVNLSADADGVVRRLPFDAGDPPPLAAAIAGRLDRNVARGAGEPRVGFLGPPGTIPSIPFEDVIAGRGLDPVRGKAVVIGLVSEGSSDVFATPYVGDNARRSTWMSGAELHAQMAETLAGTVPRDLAAPPRILVLLLIAGGCALLASRLPLTWAALPAPGLAAAVVVAGALAWRDQFLVLPVGAIVIAAFGSTAASLGVRLATEDSLRRRLQRLFGSQVSPEVVDALLETGVPTLGGELRNLTAFFSDIRSFTTISEKLQPAEVVEMLNAWFTRACAPISAEGGTIIGFAGDAVYAVFGAPIAHGDHARRALRAANAVGAASIEFRAWMVDRFGDRGVPPFAVGVGVHSGQALLGNIGSPQRMGYTAIGDAINVASRLEGLSKSMETTVVISEDARLAAGPGIEVEKTQTTQVKGRTAPLVVHGLVRINEEHA